MTFTHAAPNLQYQNPDLKIISINLNSMDAYKMNGIPVLADAKLAMKAIISAELGKVGYKSGYQGEIEKERKEWDHDG